MMMMIEDYCKWKEKYLGILLESLVCMFLSNLKPFDWLQNVFMYRFEHIPLKFQTNFRGDVLTTNLNIIVTDHLMDVWFGIEF